MKKNSGYIFFTLPKVFRDLDSETKEEYNDSLSDDGSVLLYTHVQIYNGAGIQDRVLRDIANLLRYTSVPVNGLAAFNKATIEIISTQRGALFCMPVDIEAVDLDEESMAMHYGDDFPEFHASLVQKLSKTDKGIVMFHGQPGTGKTFYIRNLVHTLGGLGKRVVIIPKTILELIGSPQFNSFMLESFKGSRTVFVLEDAEAVLTSRSGVDGRSGIISTLLNISDGILNDIFKIQVIATFNTELESIDPALLRPERLIAKREFKNLDIENSQRLIEYLEIEDFTAEEEMAVSEIYSLKNKEENDILIGDRVVVPALKEIQGFNRKEDVII